MSIRTTLIPGALIFSVLATLYPPCCTPLLVETVQIHNPHTAASRAVGQWPRESSASIKIGSSPWSSYRVRQERTSRETINEQVNANQASAQRGKTSPRASSRAGRPKLYYNAISPTRLSGRNQRVRSASANSELIPDPQALRSSSNGTKCALILQRTYVRRVYPKNPDVHESNADDGQDTEGVEPTGKQERVCISYEEINQAIADAKQKRKFVEGSLPESEIESIEPSLPVVAQIGELNQEVTKLLALKFDLSTDEILNGLPLIDMSRTDFWPICPLMVRPIQCDPTGRFRAFTGHCNNLANPTWGAAQTPFVRFVAPQHPDGVQAERASVKDGSPLPSPRLVTSMVHRDHDQPSSDLSLMIMVWGQIIDHDVALAAPPRGKSTILSLFA